MAMAGEEAAAVLLKALPADVLEAVLARMNADAAEGIRARLDAVRQRPTGTDRLDSALQTFGSTQKALATADLPVAEDVPEAPKRKVEKLQLADEIIEPVAFHHLRDIPPDLLVRVLADEQVPTMAIVVSVLDPATATAVMKRLPAEKRPELAIRLTQPGTRNPELTELLAKAVVEKAVKLAAMPAEPTPDDRIKNLSTVLRGLRREERVEIIDALNNTDPDACAKVKEQLYLFEDVLRIEDRGLQSVLVELDMPTLALALTGASEDIKAKIQRNMSSRAQAMLGEEIGLLGAVPAAKTEQARAKIVGVLRQFEEQGKIAIEV